jgi:hypothetical protein
MTAVALNTILSLVNRRSWTAATDCTDVVPRVVTLRFTQGDECIGRVTFPLLFGPTKNYGCPSDFARYFGTRA